MVNKNQIKKVEKYYEIWEYLEAPLGKSEVVGKVRYMIEGKLLCEKDVYLNDDIAKLSIGDIFIGILRTSVSGKFNK